MNIQFAKIYRRRRYFVYALAYVTVASIWFLLRSAPMRTKYVSAEMSPARFGLWEVHDFDQSPFTLTYVLLDPETAVSVLDDATQNGFKLFVDVAGPEANYRTDGHFDLDKYLAGLQSFAATGILDQWSDSVMAIMGPDKPQGANWGNGGITCDEISTALAYIKDLYPGFDTALRTRATYLSTCTPAQWSNLDMTYPIWSERLLTLPEYASFDDWVAHEEDMIVHAGLTKIIWGISVERGGFNGNREIPISANQLQAKGQLLLDEGCLVLHRADKAYEHDWLYRSVINGLADIALGMDSC